MKREWQAVAFGQMAVILVIGDYLHDIRRPFAAFVVREDVVEAMRLFGNHDGHAAALVGTVERPGDVEGIRHGGKTGREFFQREGESFQFPFHAREENGVLGIHVLVQRQNIAVLGGDEAGESGDNAALVWAGNE